MVRSSARLVGALLLLSATPAVSQPNRCADCHFANRDVPAVEHQGDWDRSEHRRRNIGCEQCHGGDATPFESTIAHLGVINSQNLASPVNRRRIA